MFGKNDKYIRLMHVFNIVAFCVFLSLFVAGGIVMCVMTETPFGVFIIVAGAIVMPVLYVAAEFLMSVARDLKFIRNKLYGESNERFADYEADAYTAPSAAAYGTYAGNYAAAPEAYAGNYYEDYSDDPVTVAELAVLNEDSETMTDAEYSRRYYEITERYNARKNAGSAGGTGGGTEK